MHLELNPAETENFKKEKAFVSLFKILLNQKTPPPPPPPISLEAFATCFPFINHLSPSKPMGISLFSLPFDSRHQLQSGSHLTSDSTMWLKVRTELQISRYTSCVDVK